MMPTAASGSLSMAISGSAHQCAILKIWIWRSEDGSAPVRMRARAKMDEIIWGPGRDLKFLKDSKEPVGSCGSVWRWGIPRGIPQNDQSSRKNGVMSQKKILGLHYMGLSLYSHTNPCSSLRGRSVKGQRPRWIQASNVPSKKSMRCQWLQRAGIPWRPTSSCAFFLGCVEPERWPFHDEWWYLIDSDSTIMKCSFSPL
jgi:hypothetical protein